MLAIFNCASAASGMLGKKVSKCADTPVRPEPAKAVRTLGVPGNRPPPAWRGAMEFGIGIGIDQGLQGHAGHVEAVVLHRVHGFIEQGLCPAALEAHVASGLTDFLLLQAAVTMSSVVRIAMNETRT